MSITLHMVTSLDGFVDSKTKDISWMDVTWSPYKQGIEMDMSILDKIECYVMGSKTYELALKLGWAYGNTRAIVVTKRKMKSDRSSVEFYDGDLKELANQLENKNVWLVGGPTLAQSFLKENLVEKVCLTVAPIALGEGHRLFAEEQRLRLDKVEAFKNGMIDLWYQVSRDS